MVFKKGGSEKKSILKKSKKGICFMRPLKKGKNIEKLRKRAIQGLKYSVKWGSRECTKKKYQCIEKVFLPKKGTFIYGFLFLLV